MKKSEIIFDLYIKEILFRIEMMTTEISNQIMPPPPPHAFIPGEFQYIESQHSRRMLQTAYSAITLLEMWNFLKEPVDEKTGFQFCRDERASQIYKKIEELGYYGHSGYTFGNIMRHMQYIAEHGEDKYYNMITTQDK